METPPLLVGMQPHAATFEICMEFSQKIQNQPTSRPYHTTLSHIPNDAQSYHKGICSTMFIAALFIIARTWKHPRGPSTEEWIKKMWYIYTVKNYSAVKNNDILKIADI